MTHGLVAPRPFGPQRRKPLESTWKRHRDAGLVLIGASVDRGVPALLRAFVLDLNITYPVDFFDQRAIEALGGVRGYPT